MSLDRLYRADDRKRGIETEARYEALRRLASLYRILAFVVGVAAVVGIVAGGLMLTGDNKGQGLVLLLGCLVGGSVQFVTLLGLADAADALIETVEKVRLSIYEVRRLGERPEGPAARENVRT